MYGKKYVGLCIVAAVWSLAFLTDGYAQIELQNPRQVAFYRYVEPGQATMKVRVWGDVSAAGLYEVQAGTDLLELLFLAGGPSGGIGRSDQRRQTVIRLSRKTNNIWSTVFEADLDDITDREQPYPPMQDGDALKVDIIVKRTLGWRDAFTVLGAIGTAVVIYDRIDRISSRD